MTLDTIHEIECKRGAIYRTGFSSNGKILASAHRSGCVSFWDAMTGDKISVDHKGHEGVGVRCLAWSPNEFRIASGDTDGNIIVWNVLKEKIDITIKKAHSNKIRSLAWSPDGTKLVSGSTDGYVRTWRLGVTEYDLIEESDNLFQNKNDTRRPTIYSVKWSPDGRELASCRREDCVIWSAISYKEIKVLTGHTGIVRSVAWSKDGKLFASCSNDRTIIIWDANNWTKKSHLKLSDGDIPRDTSIFCVHFSPKGDFIAAKSTDNSVRIWRLADERCIVRIEELCGSGMEENLGGISFHPNEPFLVTLRNNCENLRVWKLDYEFLSSAKAYYFIDQGFKSSVSHTLDFPPEYEQAALAILNYFGKIVREKYPQKNVSIQVVQDSENVTLRIETADEDREEIQSAFKNYTRVVSKKLDLESYLDSREERLELRTQLRMAETMVEFQREMLNYRNADIKVLQDLLSTAIQATNSPNNISINLLESSKNGIDEIKSSLKRDISLLDSVSENQNNEKKLDEIRKDVENNLEQALTILSEEWASNESLKNRITQLRNRLNRNQRNFNQGIILYEDYELTLNKICTSTLDYIQDIQNGL